MHYILVQSSFESYSIEEYKLIAIMLKGESCQNAGKLIAINVEPHSLH